MDDVNACIYRNTRQKRHEPYTGQVHRSNANKFNENEISVFRCCCRCFQLDMRALIYIELHLLATFTSSDPYRNLKSRQQQHTHTVHRKLKRMKMYRITSARARGCIYFMFVSNADAWNIKNYLLVNRLVFVFV